MKELVNKEVKTVETKKVKSEKENEYFEEKIVEMDQVFQKNKNYLLSMNVEEDDD